MEISIDTSNLDQFKFLLNTLLLGGSNISITEEGKY